MGMQAFNIADLNLKSYSKHIVAFSGGKDSIASFLALLEAGVPRENIELWHHDIDGREGSRLMDWESTPSYCKRFAAAFGVQIYFSWREGGFEREMLREDKSTAQTHFETPDGIKTVGGNGPKNTRLMFPQVTANLSQRWCSASLKVDVCSIAINNQTRFNGQRTLLVSGERALESEARALYPVFCEDKTNAKKRTVHHYRPVHAWTEAQVWDILKRHGVNPHPAYRLGWSRLSCMACIFGNKDQWASIKAIAPERLQQVAEYEQLFGKTIDRGGVSVEAQAARGTAYEGTSNAALVAEARSEKWDGVILIDPKNWTMPAGAFKKCGGPQ